MKTLHHTWQRYAIAIVMIAIAAGLRIWPMQLLESRLTWVTFIPAVMLVAIYGGFSAGLLSTVLACLAVTYLWPLFAAKPFINNIADWIGMAFFVLTGALVSVIAETKHRADELARRALQQAESANRALTVSAQAVAENTRFLRSITDALPSMLAYWDKDLRCRFANHAYRLWFGKSAEEIIGHTMLDLLGERLFGLNEPYIRGALAGEQQYFERVLTKDDGSIGHTWANYVPDIGDDGRVAGFFVLVTDITPLVQARAELKLAFNVLQNIVEGIMVTNVDGIIVSVNPAFTAITGYTAEEVMGKTPRMLLSGREDTIRHAEIWESVERDGTWQGELQERRKNGEEYPGWLTVTAVKNADGGVANYVTMLTDITERKRVEKMKTEFVSTVSHELRTPLTAINGALGLLAGGALGGLPGPVKQLVEVAHKNSQRLVSLINDLLDMDKLVAGKLPLDMQAQPLMPLVEQALEAIHSYGEQYEVSFKLVAREDAHVRVDGNRLTQVLNNFLSNAAKFSPLGGQVEIAVHRVNGAVRVEVRDHGAGIPAQFRERIFSKFFQADSSDTRQKGGTGLGLAISKELIERMGGVIGFESAEGQGACFYFELPL